MEAHDVAAKFLADLDSGAAGVCTLFIPSALKDCERVAIPEHFFSDFSGTARPGDSIAVANRAFVVIIGSLCNKQAVPHCMRNSDPRRGLPTASQFEAAWAYVHPAVFGSLLVRCEKVAGKWYVDPTASPDYSSSSGATGSTSTSGATGSTRGS
jgi:hypothetical protein